MNNQKTTTPRGTYHGELQSHLKSLFTNKDLEKVLSYLVIPRIQCQISYTE